MALTPSYTPSIFQGPRILEGRLSPRHLPTAISGVDHWTPSFAVSAPETSPTTTTTTIASTTVLIQPTHTEHGHHCIGAICPENELADQQAASPTDDLHYRRPTSRYREPTRSHRMWPTMTHHRWPTMPHHRGPTVTHSARPTVRFTKRPSMHPPMWVEASEATSPTSASAAEPTKCLGKRGMEWALVPGAPFWFEQPTFTSAGEQTKGRVPWETAGDCLAGVALMAFFFG